MTSADRREARKAATRATIQAHALRLFLAQGYDATTVAQVAAAAGVSHMTFFRYFPTKESVVDTDDYDPLIAELIRARPPTEDPTTAIHRALVTGLRGIPPAGRDALRVRSRLIHETPALRARQADNLQATRTLFADALAARAGLPTPTFAQQVQAAVALAAVSTALITWTVGADPTDLVTLVDSAFAALRSATSGTPVG